MSTITIVTEVAGTVWKLLVQPGDAVAADQDLVIVESMKMGIPVAAPVAGTVHRLLVVEGQAVVEGQGMALLTTRA